MSSSAVGRLIMNDGFVIVFIRMRGHAMEVLDNKASNPVSDSSVPELLAFS